ncbi:MAG: NAD-dependent succinate-semialdehyde dehydrogenase [Bdellovibrionota bacterium]
MPNTKSIQTIDPANQKILKEYAVHSASDLDRILASAHQASSSWKRSSMEERQKLLRNLAHHLRRDQEFLAELMQREMGKRLEEGKAEIEKCAATADYYAEHGAAFLEPIKVATEAEKSYVTFAPLGTVLAIMPWNFPFWQALRCAAPALLAGNSVLLKHASNVSGCSLALEKILQESAGDSHKNLFQSILLRGREVLPLIARKEISAVSFTGSTNAGREIAEVAGKALKKCVLELGGSDAYVVLADADLAEAAKICASSRLINAGQSCIAAKRFIVEKKVLPEFQRLFIKALQAVPLAPLARIDLRDQLHEQVKRTISQGATLLCGGKIPEGNGAYYPATALAGVKPGMTAFEEECFGPVAAIIEAESEKEALALANLSQFGLGAAVFTKDKAKGDRIAREELEAGSCFVNALVRSDPRLPFGGIKESGYGRELSSFGIREFVNIKTVYVS